MLVCGFFLLCIFEESFSSMEKQDEKPKQNPKVRAYSKFLRFSNMGLQMGLTIWLASMLGKWLDNKLQHEAISYFKIITMLAVIGSTYSFILQVKKLTAEDEKNASDN